MNDLTFLDAPVVTLRKAAAEDADVVEAAKVSTEGELSRYEGDVEDHAGLINFLMRNRHGTPFEHNMIKFRVKAPIFVFREIHRHRIGMSYNEESGRYRELAPEFYIPGPDRALVQVGKAGAYDFVPGTPEQYDLVTSEMENAYRVCYRAYQEMLVDGVAREVARMVLPVGLYSNMYLTCNARSLMAFLSLRTKHPDAKFPSYPQREIEMVAERMEEEFARLMPITYAAFVRNGRVCP